MNILAIETSSSVCSVALRMGHSVIEHQQSIANQHSQVLLEFVRALLDQAQFSLEDLHAIAVGNGPGSFTGLRLGLGVSQGLAMGVNKPIIPISSLSACALQADNEYIFTAIDARMSEVYWQCFKREINADLIALDVAQLDRPENISIKQLEYDFQGIGSGFDQYPDQLGRLLKTPENWINNVTPNAVQVAELAVTSIKNSGMPEKLDLVPAYVRNNVTN